MLFEQSALLQQFVEAVGHARIKRSCGWTAASNTQKSA
jgi:hypothetical protein